MFKEGDRVMINWWKLWMRRKDTGWSVVISTDLLLPYKRSAVNDLDGKYPKRKVSI